MAARVGAKHQSTDYRRESGVSYYMHQTVCSGGHLTGGRLVHVHLERPVRSTYTASPTPRYQLRLR